MSDIEPKQALISLSDQLKTSVFAYTWFCTIKFNIKGINLWNKIHDANQSTEGNHIDDDRKDKIDVCLSHVIIFSSISVPLIINVRLRI